MSPLHAKLASAILALGVAIPATAHAVRARAEERRAEETIAALAKAIGAIGASEAAAQSSRVTLNGAPVIFRRSTEHQSIDEIMTTVAHECESGDRDVALAMPSASRDGVASSPIRLERIMNQESASGVRASLCIFAGDTARDDEMPRVRYTLARRVDDETTSVTTVAYASGATLGALFPADGDAPGSDLEGVARPERTRRTLTALVGDGNYAVRVYESPLSVDDAVASYDAAMAARGFATTAALKDARMYRKEETSIVASFLETSEGSAITVAPFR